MAAGKSAGALFLIFTLLSGVTASAQYQWLDDYDNDNCIAGRIEAPEGYRRIAVEEGSFQHWLRNLPLKDGDPPIHLYNGEEKLLQAANHAVVDIDTGDKDLQQCADAVIRLRAEYLYMNGQYDSIAFNFTSGDRFPYSDWLGGLTPVMDGDKLKWRQSAGRENNRQNFKKYLEIVFTYAGSHSLCNELGKIDDIFNMRIGDIFIEGGFPGHAVFVVDMAENEETGERIFLMAQSYTPAQDIHIIKNPISWILSPWFRVDFGKRLYTLEWVFEKDDLMRFK
jgi:hypothetical protein